MDFQTWTFLFIGRDTGCGHFFKISIMSSVAYLDLNAYQNEDFDADVSLNKIISKLAFDARNFELKGEIRKHHLSKEPSATFFMKPSSSGGSAFNMSLSSQQTKSLRAGRYIYDVFIVDRSNNIAKYSTYFNGTPLDYIYVNPANININYFVINKKRFTLDLWIYPLTYQNCSFLNVGNGLYFGIENSKLVLKNAGTEILSYEFLPELNKWTQIKIARNTDETDLVAPTKCKYLISYNGSEASNTGDLTVIADFGSNGTVRIGESFGGYISNLRLTNGTYFTDYAKTEIAVPSGETILLTCRDESFVDNSKFSFGIIPTGSVKPDSKSPFVSDIVSYKLLEGCLFINPSATKFSV